jgi:hypothetical protein
MQLRVVSVVSDCDEAQQLLHPQLLVLYGSARLDVNKMQEGQLSRGMSCSIDCGGWICSYPVRLTRGSLSLEVSRRAGTAMQPAAQESAARPGSEGKVLGLEVLRGNRTLSARERAHSNGASFRQILRGICGWACGGR